VAERERRVEQAVPSAADDDFAEGMLAQHAAGEDVPTGGEDGDDIEGAYDYYADDLAFDAARETGRRF
jgi:hypothetical protein